MNQAITTLPLTSVTATAVEVFSFGWWIIKIIFMLLVLLVTLTAVAYETYLERKVLGRAQVRYGPNRTGPFGLLQPLADAIKLITKEDIIPSAADKWVFYFAPIISLFTGLTIIAVIPFGPADTPLPFTDLTFNPFIGDVNVALLMVLALSSFGVYGIIMAGWSSNNKYALLGGLRSSAQVISYEIIMGISLVGVMLFTSSLSLQGIVSWQAGWGNGQMWLIFLQPVGFICFLIAGMAETNRNPFDLPEAETELVAGYHVEYSGIRFGMYMLSEFLAVIVISVMTTTLFFGGWDSPLAWLAPLFGERAGGEGFLGFFTAPSVFWVLFKLAFGVFFFFWLRATLPRFRYDQLMGLCWKVLLPIVLVNILLTALLNQLYLSFGQPAWGFYVIAAIEILWAILVVTGLSRLASGSWFTSSNKPKLSSGREMAVPPSLKVAGVSDRSIRMGTGRADTTGVQ